MGLVTPTSGTVRVLGAEMPRERYRVLHRMNFESPYVEMPMRLTIRQNLTVFGMLYGVGDLRRAHRRDRRANSNSTDLLDRPTGKLSAGQKTRVSLAKALINAPDLLLLDEPTASLDPDTADWVRARLERYRDERGATLLIASHNMAEVERLCERVIFMKQGRIEDDDTPARPARALRPRHAGGGVPRRRARTRDARGARHERADVIAFSPRRVAAMVLRYWYLLRSSLAAPDRADLLAGRADADVGLPADLSRRAGEHVRARRRRAHRRGAAVGHPVPRAARILDLVPRGDVCAQSRQPDDLAAARRPSSSPR